MIIANSSEKDKMKFKINYEMHVKEEKLYKNNIIRAYTTISYYCSTIIQPHICELSDYITKIINNSIALLAAIKKLMYNIIRAKYLYATLIDAFQHLINIK